MRILGIILAVIIVLCAAFGLYVYSEIRTITIEELTEDLHVIYGLGGNVAVLRTGDGAVVVDTMTFTMQGDLILEAARELTGEDVVMVINSHYHSDHTHGNPAFEPGTRVLSTERTRWHLAETDAAYFENAEALMPNETFEASHHHISLGNKNLTLLHPGRGHTDGDLVVLFEEDKAVHLGDMFFNRYYPNIDLEAGGSVQEWPASIDRVFSELDFDIVIPGHGPVSGPEDLRQFQSFIKQLGHIGSEAMANNWSLEETIATDLLTEDEGYSEIVFILPIGLSREFVLTRSWEETHGAFELRE